MEDEVRELERAKAAQIAVVDQLERQIVEAESRESKALEEYKKAYKRMNGFYPQDDSSGDDLSEGGTSDGDEHEDGSTEGEESEGEVFVEVGAGAA